MELWKDLAPLLHRSWNAACVDIPIGFPESGERRSCDIEARRILGPARSSVFFAPPRHCIEATEYEQVRSLGMSIQMFNILPKVREMDRLITPQLQRVVREAHPELAFRTRSASALDKKRTAAGRSRRCEILEQLGSPFRLDRWEGEFRRKEVALDDLLDAAALLEVARTSLSGEMRSVGGRERDSRGLKMEICY